MLTIFTIVSNSLAERDNAVLMMELIAGAAMFLPALVAIVWAVRGRRVGDHPYCRKCGFDLFGKPADSHRCSECGTELAGPRCVVIGIRQARRRVALGGVFVLILGTMVGGAPAYRFGAELGPEYWHRAKMWYWLRQCRNYSAPADEVVYDQDPGGASPYLNQPQYTTWNRYDLQGGLLATATRVPECYAQFEQEYSGFPFKNTLPVLFLHDRRGPSGRHYLIVISGDQYVDDTLPIPQLRVSGDQSLLLGGLLEYPQPTSYWGSQGSHFSGFGGNATNSTNSNKVRVFAGQADPNDESHFTICYTVDVNSRTIDGYVGEVTHNTGAFSNTILRVKFVQRDPPVTWELP